MLKIILTKNQWSRLSEITGNLSLVFFASVVIPYTLDKADLITAGSGTILTLLALVISLILERKTK